jgi:hypothetical protein
MSEDYERPLTTVADARGGELKVVRHYTDAIILADPVKVVVYDPGGGVVAETPYYRDVVTYRSPDAGLYLFGLFWTEFFFHKAWSLRDGSLVPVHRPRCYVYATLASLRAHWLGYGVSASLCVAGMVAWLSRARTAGAWDVRPGALGVSALVWLWLVLMYGRLSITVVLMLGLAGSLPFARDWGEGVLVAGVLGGGAVLVWLVFTFLKRLLSPQRRRGSTRESPTGMDGR